MAKIMRPEQVAKRLGFPDTAKFRRQFSDLVTVVSGQELMDLDFAEERLYAMVNPDSDIWINRKQRSYRKATGDNIGQVRSRILRLQKSIRKTEPAVTSARELYEKTGKPADKLAYLELNEALMSKEKSLLKGREEYDRIIRERIEEIEGPAGEDEISPAAGEIAQPEAR